MKLNKKSSSIVGIRISDDRKIVITEDGAIIEDVEFDTLEDALAYYDKHLSKKFGRYKIREIYTVTKIHSIWPGF